MSTNTEATFGYVADSPDCVCTDLDGYGHTCAYFPNGTAVGDRKPLTSTVWADFPNGLSSKQSSSSDSYCASPVYWDAAADLGYELAARTDLDVRQCRLLVEAALNGLPVVLTWTTPLQSRYEADLTETTTTVVNVSSLIPPMGDRKVYPGQVRINHWGFSHPVYLDRIVDVTTFKTERSYS